MSYSEHSFGGSYPSAEMLSVYSSVPNDWTGRGHISRDCLVCLDVYTSPQICPSFFNALSFGWILNPFGFSVWICLLDVLYSHLPPISQTTQESRVWHAGHILCFYDHRYIVLRVLRFFLWWLNLFLLKPWLFERKCCSPSISLLKSIDLIPCLFTLKAVTSDSSMAIVWYHIVKD